MTTDWHDGWPFYIPTSPRAPSPPLVERAETPGEES